MQEATTNSAYQLPPPEVVALVDARPDEAAFLSPDCRWMLMVEGSPHPSIRDLARPIKKLAGLRFDPVTRSYFSTDYYTNLRIRALEDEQEISIPLPPSCRIARASWSHRCDSVALSLETEHGRELWWFSVSDPAHPRKLVDSMVENIGGFNWTSDGRRLICHLRVDDYRPLPAEPKFPSGPVIEESSGVESPARTYQDLLGNAYEADLFECFVTTQIAIVDPEKNRIDPIGPPGMYFKVIPSPDGNHYLVRRLKRPFSYTLPMGFFPSESVVWDRSGNTLYTVNEHGILDSIPIEGVPTVPRRIGWKSGKPAQLIWVEALDGGDPRNTVEHRDRLMGIQAPFVDEPIELLRIQHRYDGRVAFSDPDLLLVYQYDRDRRWVRATLHHLYDPAIASRILIDRSVNDYYNSPGSILTKCDETGMEVAEQLGNSIFLVGSGATPEGLLPFLDLWDLSSWTKKRLWRCEPGFYEHVLDVTGTEEDLKILTSRESKLLPTNCWLRSSSGAEAKQLTQFTDPTPQVRQFRKELVKYYRDDGTELSATLYLPPNYQEGQRLPLLIWAYPQEYNDAQTAGQVTTSPNRFTSLAGCSHLMLLTQGYAVLNNATMPIVGDPATMNDTFIEQIVAAARAAIDFVVSMGVADPDRIAIGGHSYGAFMVANLMAHSELFRAGIARSGAYNRTLTPFGFQSERRPLWEAKHIYHNISPFMHAEKIKRPLLLIHGEDDNNAGTLALQSKRMYQAIKGNGGIARLVLLPHESHGYRARESMLHTQAEMINWLNRHLPKRAQ